MCVKAIDKFNEILKSEGSPSEFTLHDDIDEIDNNYILYIADPDGNPDDDFPGKYPIWHNFTP